ncbi:hypothetical protein BJX62DRAFT_209728 [Aspergillus germanicus]
MKFLAGALITLGTLTAQAISAAIELPFEKREKFIPTWDFPVFPSDTTPTTFNGTIQEAHAELLRRNPNWDTEFSHLLKRSPVPVAVTEAGTEEDSGVIDLAKRTDFASLLCYDQTPWEPAGYHAINEGIAYLRGLSGRPGMRAGPSACGRVSCSWNAAIWWCNDANEFKLLESYNSIADGAAILSQHCFRDGNWEPRVVGGQIFHETNWNVIVREDEC